ncbi:NPP1 family protein [Streptomyces sp. NPDC096132]|uniref:NPP1 family protein n=1 Tax=Streptomyces sp. NPDC096132 TaxID=3366075 RepID=UPI0037FB5108
MGQPQRRSEADRGGTAAATDHLTNANTYARAKCNNGWCGIVYSLYFEQDQVYPGIGHSQVQRRMEHAGPGELRPLPEEQRPQQDPVQPLGLTAGRSEPH